VGIYRNYNKYIVLALNIAQIIDKAKEYSQTNQPDKNIKYRKNYLYIIKPEQRILKMSESFVGKVIRLINPVIPIEKVWSGIPLYFKFWRDFKKYKKMVDSKSPKITFLPSLHEMGESHEFDAHYQYQSLWALKKTITSNPAKHIDVGSQLNFGLTLSLNLPVEFIDLRHLNINWPGFTMVTGSILNLPYPDNSIVSLSCMHVIEHIGLGRYGDPLNPNGSVEAACELSRIMAPGGNLFLTTPIGKSKVAFNSHRIHTTKEIIGMFGNLKLNDFSIITDEGKYIEKASPENYDNSNYACGLFHFTK
jgi:hypothetical protein